jgi:hypothetical protein
LKRCLTQNANALWSVCGEATSINIPEDFVDALEDFGKGRFVSMNTALNETPPDA